MFFTGAMLEDLGAATDRKIQLNAGGAGCERRSEAGALVSFYWQAAKLVKC